MVFVKKRTDYEFELDPKYYQVAKDLWKKKNWRRLKEPIILKVDSASQDPSQSRSFERNNSIMEFSSGWRKATSKENKVFPTAIPTYYEVDPNDYKTPAFEARKLGLHGGRGLLSSPAPQEASRRASGVTFGVATPLLAKKSKRLDQTGDSWAVLSPRNSQFSGLHSGVPLKDQQPPQNPVFALSIPIERKPLLLTPARPSKPQPAMSGSPPVSGSNKLKTFRLTIGGPFDQRSSSQDGPIGRLSPSPVSSKPDPLMKRNSLTIRKTATDSASKQDTRWADCLKSAANKTKRMEGMFFCPNML